MNILINIPNYNMGLSLQNANKKIKKLITYINKQLNTNINYKNVVHQSNGVIHLNHDYNLDSRAVKQLVSNNEFKTSYGFIQYIEDKSSKFLTFNISV